MCVYCSVTPTLASPSPAPNATNPNDSESQPNPVEIDKTKPTTSIQIRLADGSRLVGIFNYSHTVGDIRRFINAYPFSMHYYKFIIAYEYVRNNCSQNQLCLNCDIVLVLHGYNWS